MDITNDKFEKFDSEEPRDNVVTPTTYKRKIFGRQKTCRFTRFDFLNHYLYTKIMYYGLVSETSIYNPIDPQNRDKSGSKYILFTFSFNFPTLIYFSF